MAGKWQSWGPCPYPVITLQSPLLASRLARIPDTLIELHLHPRGLNILFHAACDCILVRSGAMPSINAQFSNFTDDLLVFLWHRSKCRRSPLKLPYGEQHNRVNRRIERVY